jgi:hypothetical protein
MQIRQGNEEVAQAAIGPQRRIDRIRQRSAKHIFHVEALDGATLHRALRKLSIAGRALATFLASCRISVDNVHRGGDVGPFHAIRRVVRNGRILKGDGINLVTRFLEVEIYADIIADVGKIIANCRAEFALFESCACRCSER